MAAVRLASSGIDLSGLPAAVELEQRWQWGHRNIQM